MVLIMRVSGHSVGDGGVGGGEAEWETETGSGTDPTDW